MKKRVYVGISGGVDSSVAALRLLRQDHEVVGVFIKVWQPEFLACDWEKERLDAMRVAATLGIPFITLDAVEEYKREVADYMIREYREGRTPNPDVMCNQHVKFGRFLSFARTHGADMIATGHYARKIEAEGRQVLLRGIDQSKDQSYFLWTLSQKQLAQALFPVGDTRKDTIRKEAAAAGLPVSKKKDSQGICFLGQVDIKEFLSHYVEVTEGLVLNETGEPIGRHDGALFYTVGQRHGFTIEVKGKESVPHYVINKDLDQNTLTVSETIPQVESGNEILLTDLNSIVPQWKKQMTAQCRYRQKPFTVELAAKDETTARLTVTEPDVECPSKGQSCVLYDGETCLGGGIIS